MSGPKIDVDAVQSAMKVVDDGQMQMESVTKQILASSGISLQAIKAPAGQITADTFGQLGGGGKALAEQLASLRVDLGKLVQVAMSGSDDATAAARSASGVSAATAAGMA